MTNRMKVATAGEFATAEDYSDNAAIGKVLKCVPGATPVHPKQVAWGDGYESNLAVADLTALVALTGVGFGQTFRVETVGRSYQFTLAGVSPLEPMVVLAGIGGNWQSLIGTSDQRWLKQASWYLDGVAGNDENVGDVQAAPIRSGAELLRRLNNQRVLWDHNVAIYVLDAIDALVLDYMLMAPNLTVKIIGSGKTVTVNGVDTTVIQYTAAAGNAPRKIAAAGVDWNTSGPGASSLLRRRMRVTAGTPANVGAVGWLLKSSPDAGDPASVVRISKPTQKQSSGGVTLVNGDTIMIEDLPSIGVFDIRFGGYVYHGFTQGVGQLQVESIASSICNVVGFCWYNYGVSLFGCNLSGDIYGVNWAHRISGYLVGCLISTAQFSGFSTVACAWVALDTSTSVVIDGPFTVLAGDTVQGIRLAQIAPTMQLEGETFLCDSPSDALSIAKGCQLSTVASLRGYGAVGAGVRVTATSQFLYTSGAAPTITGTAGNCILQPQGVVIPWTALPWTDGSRVLSTALVGGTKVVPVPYMLTTQKVMATKDTPTAAGELSIPTATITNTQFVVNSSNGADTSSVNCYVMPTGWGHWINF